MGSLPLRALFLSLSECAEVLSHGPALKRWRYGLCPGFLVGSFILGRDGHSAEKVGPLFSK